jgi:hypothetical protein
VLPPDEAAASEHFLILRFASRFERERATRVREVLKEVLSPRRSVAATC